MQDLDILPLYLSLVMLAFNQHKKVSSERLESSGDIDLKLSV